MVVVQPHGISGRGYAAESHTYHSIQCLLLSVITYHKYWEIQSIAFSTEERETFLLEQDFAYESKVIDVSCRFSWSDYHRTMSQNIRKHLLIMWNEPWHKRCKKIQESGGIKWSGEDMNLHIPGANSWSKLISSYSLELASVRCSWSSLSWIFSFISFVCVVHEYTGGALVFVSNRFNLIFHSRCPNMSI